MGTVHWCWPVAGVTGGHWAPTSFLGRSASSATWHGQLCLLLSLEAWWHMRAPLPWVVGAGRAAGHCTRSSLQDLCNGHNALQAPVIPELPHGCPGWTLAGHGWITFPQDRWIACPLGQADHIPSGTGGLHPSEAGGSHPSGLEPLPFPGSAEPSHRVPAGRGEAGAGSVCAQSQGAGRGLTGVSSGCGRGEQPAGMSNVEVI